MKDKYIMAMLLGTQDRVKDEYPHIPLYAKASEHITGDGKDGATDEGN